MRNFILVSLSLTLLACGDDDPIELTHDHAGVAGFLYVDGDGNPIDEGTPAEATLDKVVGEARVPVVDPRGEAVTWGRFMEAAGTVHLSCDGDETQVDIEATGLLGDGVYTAWLIYFQEPGSAEAGLAAFAGLEAVGPRDGSGSVLTVDADGRGTLSTTVTPGDVAMAAVDGFALEGCLQDAYEVWLTLAYHMDGETCGDFPCTDDTIAEQHLWAFGGGAAR